MSGVKPDLQFLSASIRGIRGKNQDSLAAQSRGSDLKTRDAKQWRGANLLHGLGWHYCPVCFLIIFL
jgi:hypothetical protein